MKEKSFSALRRALNRRWLDAEIGDWLLLILLVAVSLGVYLYAPGFSMPVWQVHHFDHADYRFLAEHFWGMPHDLSTYAVDFSGAWGQYLTRVPFREIGMGSVYLLINSLYGEAAFPWVMRILLVLSVAIWFRAARLAVDSVFALFTSALLLFPPSQWVVGEQLLTEPLLRVFLMIAGAALLGSPRNVPRAGLMFFVMVALCALVKVQWFMLAFLMLPFLTWEGWRARMPRRAWIAWLIALAAVPGLVIGTHLIGWGWPGLTAGTGFHMNLLSGDRYRTTFCEQRLHQRALCTSPSVIDYWGVPAGDEIPLAEFREFDKAVLPYVLDNPRMIFPLVKKGVLEATNFPFFRPVKPAVSETYPILHVFDFGVWWVLIAALFWRKTRLMGAFGLALWAVPTIGMVFSVYDERYHIPMAGMPVGLALLALALMDDPKILSIASLRKRRARK